MTLACWSARQLNLRLLEPSDPSLYPWLTEPKLLPGGLFYFVFLCGEEVR